MESQPQNPEFRLKILNSGLILKTFTPDSFLREKPIFCMPTTKAQKPACASVQSDHCFCYSLIFPLESRLAKGVHVLRA